MKYQGVDARDYGKVLARLIRADFPATIRVEKLILDFSRLHDFVDANEYLIDADTIMGIDIQELSDEYVIFTDVAIGHAFRDLNAETYQHAGV